MRNRIIISLVVAAILITLAFFAYNFFTSEQVTVKSNSANAKISIYTLDDEVVESKKAPYSARMKPGNYAVVVTEDEKETRSVFSLELGKPVDMTLNLSNVKGVTDVAPYAGTYIFAADNFLNILRSRMNQLDRVTFGDKYLKVLSQGAYGQAYWANSDQAILVDTANKNHLYNAGNVTPLGYDLSNPNTISFWNGAIAYATNKTATIRPSITAEPRVSLTIDYIQPYVALGPEDHLLIYETGVPGDGDANGEQIPLGEPAVYKSSEKLEAQSNALKGFIIDGAAWSPDGKKLAFSAGTGIYVLDVNTSEVTQLYLSYTTHPQSLLWLDNQSITYFLDQKIWKINLGTPITWNLLAKVEGSLGWKAPLVLSPDKTKMYYSTQGLKASDDGIYSIDLK